MNLPLLSDSLPWLTVLLLVPVVGAVAVAAVPQAREALAKQLALGISLVVLVLTVLLALSFSPGGPRFQFEERTTWIPSLGVSYAMGVDGIALVLILLGVVLTPICILASWHDALHPGGVGATGRTRAVSPDDTAELPTPKERRTGGRRVQTFFALLLLVEASIIGVFAATDVFLFYVFFEAMLIPMYFLIGSYGGAQRSYAAVKFLLYSLFGGLIMLAAVIGVYLAGPGGSRGFLFSALSEAVIDPTTQRWLFAGFFLAFAIKAPLWPVHTWLPDAAAESPAGATVLLVGVLDKVGTFGMLRYCLELFPEASRWATPFVLTLAVIGILYGALVAVGQTDMRRLIAYTSVSHFGFIVVGIFAMTALAQTGATFYMVNHGFATGLLFLVAGMLIARRSSRRIADYGGVARVAPLLAGSFLIAGLATLSLPGLSTFISEFQVLIGTFPTYPVVALVSLLGVVLAAVYVLVMYQRVMSGPYSAGESDATPADAASAPTATRSTTGSPTPAPASPGGAVSLGSVSSKMPDLRAREIWVVAPLIAALIGLGFYPKPILDIIDPAVQATMQSVEQVKPPTRVPASAAEGERP